MFGIFACRQINPSTDVHAPGPAEQPAPDKHKHDPTTVPLKPALKNTEEPSVRKGVGFSTPSGYIDLSPLDLSPAPVARSFRRSLAEPDVLAGSGVSRPTTCASTAYRTISGASAMGNRTLSGASAGGPGNRTISGASAALGDEEDDEDAWSYDGGRTVTGTTVRSAAPSVTAAAAPAQGQGGGGGGGGGKKRLKGHRGTWSRKVLSALHLLPDSDGRTRLPSVMVFTQRRPPLAARTVGRTWWTKVKGWAESVGGRAAGGDRAPAASGPNKSSSVRGGGAFADDTAHGGGFACGGEEGLSAAAVAALDTSVHGLGLGLGWGAGDLPASHTVSLAQDVSRRGLVSPSCAAYEPITSPFSTILTAPAPPSAAPSAAPSAFDDRSTRGGAATLLYDGSAHAAAVAACRLDKAASAPLRMLVTPHMDLGSLAPTGAPPHVKAPALERRNTMQGGGGGGGGGGAGAVPPVAHGAATALVRAPGRLSARHHSVGLLDANTPLLAPAPVRQQPQLQQVQPQPQRLASPPAPLASAFARHSSGGPAATALLPSPSRAFGTLGRSISSEGPLHNGDYEAHGWAACGGGEGEGAMLAPEATAASLTRTPTEDLRGLSVGDLVAHRPPPPPQQQQQQLRAEADADAAPLPSYAAAAADDPMPTPRILAPPCRPGGGQPVAEDREWHYLPGSVRRRSEWQ